MNYFPYLQVQTDSKTNYRQPGIDMIKKISLIALCGFYIVAGLNHFINPEFYIALIPPYFKFVTEINIISGLIEVILAVLLISPKTRNWASYGIIAMLLAFIPAHMYSIEMGGCISNSLCVPVWVVWVRLVVIHPILIYWAFMHRK